MTGPVRPDKGHRWTGSPDAAARDRQRRADMAEQRRRLDEQRRALLRRHVAEFERICGPMTPPPLRDSDIEAVAAWAPVRHRPGCADARCSGWPCDPFDRPGEPGHDG